MDRPCIWSGRGRSPPTWLPHPGLLAAATGSLARAAVHIARSITRRCSARHHAGPVVGRRWTLVADQRRRRRPLGVRAAQRRGGGRLTCRSAPRAITWIEIGWADSASALSRPTRAHRRLSLIRCASTRPAGLPMTAHRQPSALRLARLQLRLRVKCAILHLCSLTHVYPPLPAVRVLHRFI